MNHFDHLTYVCRVVHLLCAYEWYVDRSASAIKVVPTDRVENRILKFMDLSAGTGGNWSKGYRFPTILHRVVRIWISPKEMA